MASTDEPDETARWTDDAPCTGRVRAGSLLLSSTDLSEPTFRRTVIYIIEHNDAGTLGVVVNRMSQTAVHNLLPQWSNLAARPRAVFIGGPVKQDAALCLGVVRRGVDTDRLAGVRPVDGRVVLVDLDSDPADLHECLDGVRIFAGYAGWSLGQLEDELARDAWLVASALPNDLLVPADRDLFATVLRRQPWPLPLLATHPIDVDRN
ncbi:YqgE/AlgH family protein [Williamsia sp. CHRR-6]|uniref:YqgE/AlgH family protein n=1 Tax=Williamsia sp. CHRR-6 TaxID=2835871 RepID=UPI001BDA7AEB|nr:YqgE/AlgH family protein [Williamsia sp. CHRR-6]MBT0567769.1 YqgE/AlgH family protein [Williamsia sp. CHRR-6]